MMNPPPTQRLPQQGYGQPNPQTQFRRVAPGADPRAQLSGALDPRFGRQPPSDSAPPRYQLDITHQQQSIVPNPRDRQASYTGAGNHGGSGGYYQSAVPTTPYGQTRPAAPTGYPTSAAPAYGYSTQAPGGGMYRQGPGPAAPHTPVTPTAQQSAYGMRSMYQAPNSYQNFQASYGRYPQGVVGYRREQMPSGSAAMQPQGQGGGGFPPQYGMAPLMGRGGRPQSGGYARPSDGPEQQMYDPRGHGRGRGRGVVDHVGAPAAAVGGAAAGPPTGQTPQQPPQPNTESAVGPPTAPDATEDPNVPAEKPMPRRVGIEPPIRSLLSFERAMYQEPERFFRVMDFDVLGDKVWRSARSYQKPPIGRQDFWSWEYRKDFLMKEITQYQPDIICLQEVDHYEYFEQNLAPLGYIGVYEQRKPTGQSRLYVVHGLAVFWQSTKFEYLGRRTEALGDPHYVNEMGLCVRLRRCDPSASTDAATSPKNVVVDIWNTHLIEGRSNQVEKRRLKQAQELIDHIARVSHIDLPDRTMGRPRTAAERDKPLMEPKAEFEPLVLVDPTSAVTKEDEVMPPFSEPPAMDVVATVGRDVTDIESNKEDEVRATDDGDMDPESKEREPGNPLQELFRAKMNVAISVKVDPIAEEKEDFPSYDPVQTSDYHVRRRSQGAPPELLRYPVILCGNFNCAPYPDDVGKDPVQPSTYSYLTFGSDVSSNNTWLQKAYDMLASSARMPRRGWIMESAYASSFGEPLFTVWPDKKNNQKPYPVDYVFFTKNPTSGLAVLAVLEPLPKSWVEAGAARSLPCHSFPSDHIPLMCDFEYRGG